MIHRFGKLTASKKIARHFLPHYHTDGNHRRATALSIPALFVYLQLLIVLTASLWLVGLKFPHILGTASFSADQIIVLTNAKRTQNGFSPLSQNSLLTQAATAKANDMFANDYWAHNSPKGKTPWNFISAAGYKYVFAGENLARDFNDAASVVDAWMDSPSHRSNLLDSNFKEIGVAVENGKFGGREETLVVQMFGTSIAQVPSQEPLAQATPAPQIANESSQLENTVNREPITVNSAEQATVLATHKFSIAKGASLLVIGLMFFLFLLEVSITLRRSHLKLRRGVLAHLMILGFVLFCVWYAVAGAIR